MTENKVFDCCPVCGHQFDEVKSINVCLRCGEQSAPDQLIHEEDDYAWCL
jgi:hypothetical protein